MVKRSEWRQKHGQYVAYGTVERRIVKKHKDELGQVVHIRDYLIPKIKKAEPLDALGWITLSTRLSTLIGVFYLVAKTVIEL